MAEQAAALLKAGRFHEIVGVRPGATKEDVKKACQSARLRTHPDKQGGDTALFRVVEEAVQQLLYECPRFDGPIPAWAVSLFAKIEGRQNDIDNWHVQVNELRSDITRAKTDREKAAAQKSLATAECLLAGDVEDLQNLREDCAKRYRKHVQDQEASAAREEQMMKQAHQKMVQASRERDCLRRRTSRKSSSRFPTLPREAVEAVRLEFTGLRTKFRKLSQTRSRYAKEGRDVTTVNRELGELMSQARSVADAAVAGRCQARGLHMLFPHLARTHPKYSSLATLRQAHRRLCDRICKARKSGVTRDDLEAEDAEIVRQAWAALTRMSCEPDPVDTNVL